METASGISDTVFGISGIELNDEIVGFGHGIELRSTYAHVFSTDILAYERPASLGSYHPGPWQATSHAYGIDILAELIIPASFKYPALTNLAVGHTIISLLRLWVDPQINIQVLTDGPIAGLKDRAKKTARPLQC